MVPTLPEPIDSILWQGMACNGRVGQGCYRRSDGGGGGDKNGRVRLVSSCLKIIVAIATLGFGEEGTTTKLSQEWGENGREAT